MRRLDRGALVPAAVRGPASETAETPAPPGTVRLAVGGHPACLDRCGGAGGQGYAPDTHLQAAIARVRAMVAGGAGPAALLIGGGRASVGGEPLDLGGARRYRELTQGAGVPTYVLPGPGDLPNGGADAFAAAFASAPAPQGIGRSAGGRRSRRHVPQPDTADAGTPAATFAFDVRAAAGTVRVIAIDNAAGQLAGGPDGAQAQLDARRDGAGTQARASRRSWSAACRWTTPRSPRPPPTPPTRSRCSRATRRPTSRPPASTIRNDRHFGGVLSQSVVAAPGARRRWCCCSPRRSATRRPRASSTAPFDEERASASRAPRC